MLHQIERMDVSDIRGIAALVVSEASVPHSLVETARDTVSDMRRNGAEHGLSERDIITALLKPVFAKNRGCDCWSCHSRKAQESGQNPERHVSVGS